jgi:glycosyltransferase involved in cell wall biosynthesis
MLTPDEGRLDRRIAQEAATLARLGWHVDIASTIDPGLAYDGTLTAGTRLLTDPRSIGTGGGVGRLRGLKRWLRSTSATAYWLADAIQYSLRDSAKIIERQNLGWLIDLGPYQAIFAHDIPVLPLALRLRAVQGGKVICDLHEAFPMQADLLPSGAARRYWTKVQSRVEEADHLLFVNSGVRQYIERTHASSPPGTVILNSVPFRPAGGRKSPKIRQIYSIPASSRILLFAGSLRAGNNLRQLIEGFALAGLDGWVLAVLGEGPMLSELNALVSRAGLQHRVFLGARSSQDDLVEVASGADAGVLPYLSTTFNTAVATPNKLFEYIQARLPIVGSRLPVVEELMAPVGTYVSIDFRDPDAIATGLHSYAAERFSKITRDALEGAASTYCWEVDEAELVGVLERTGLSA